MYFFSNIGSVLVVSFNNFHFPFLHFEIHCYFRTQLYMSGENDDFDLISSIVSM